MRQRFAVAVLLATLLSPVGASGADVGPMTRMAVFGEIQRLLSEDIPLVPSHQYTYMYVQDTRVDGLQRYPLIDVSRGYITWASNRYQAGIRSPR